MEHQQEKLALLATNEISGINRRCLKDDNQKKHIQKCKEGNVYIQQDFNSTFFRLILD